MISNICIFGDSVAKGVILDAAQNKYTFLKESFAHLISCAQHIAISNYAKFGCTVTKGWEVLSRHREQLPQYDAVLLEFGGNDCDYDWAKVSAAPFEDHLCKTPPDQFEKSYAGMIENVRACGGNPVLLGLPPIDSERYFAWLSRGLNPENILHWLGDVERIHRWQATYNEIVKKLADALQVPFLDIRSAFMETDNYRDYLCADGIHPNKQGHLLISQAIEGRAFA